MKIEENKFVCIQALIKNDIFDIYKSNNLLKKVYSDIQKTIYYDILTVPRKYKENYLLNLGLKLLINDIDLISNQLKNKYNEYKNLKIKI